MTKARNIQGVEIIPLRQIPDDKGMVMHMLRSDSPYFTKFGEIYFSVVKFKKIKAWKRHKLMTQNFAVPVGRINVVLFDDRPDSPTRGLVQEVRLGQSEFSLLKIPPMLWYGFTGLTEEDSLIVNCADLPHDPLESERIDAGSSQIPYQWKVSS